MELALDRRVSKPADDTGCWRDLVRAAPCRPYDLLDASPPSADARLIAAASRILNSGWSFDGFTVAVAPPIDWRHANRSCEFHLHAWDPLTIVLKAYELTGEARFLKTSRKLAMDWYAACQAPLLELPRSQAIRLAMAKSDAMVWYDMAVGQRAYRLAYLIEAMCRSDYASDDDIGKLFQSLLFHMRLLAEPGFFTSHNNHGLYQALGLIAAATRFEYLPAFATHKKVASARVDLMMTRSFFPSGAHREHSPGYHYMILSTCLGARAGGLLSAASAELLAASEEIMAWMIAPSGKLAAIGDTDPLAVDDLAAFAGDGSIVAAALGEAGDRPAPFGLKVADDAGYVFYRSPDNSSYLAQIAGFHSRTHKHADHFSFVWCEHGEELLLDPGRYNYAKLSEPGSELRKAGFWYSDPWRVFVETTRAHNCIEFDGQDYPRHGHYGRPFGSGLMHADVSDDGLITTLCAGRFNRSVKHWRALILDPGRFLIVLDWARDASETPHEARQWFHFGPQWAIGRSDDGYRGRSRASPIRVASFLEGATAQRPVRGQIDPICGWRSDKASSMEPTTTICMAQEAKPLLAFATLFSLSDRLEISPQTRANASMTTARFRWTDDIGETSLSFSKVGEQLTVLRT